MKQQKGLKVGEVAKRTGLTVRALHHYDALGLLSPSETSPAGHRLYTRADFARLHQIVSLRQLGFPLKRIKQLLEQPGYSLPKIIGLQLAAAREQLEETRKLCRRLEALAERLRSRETVSLSELLENIEVITMHEKFFTPEQLAALKERAKLLGPAGKAQNEKEWKELFAQLKAEQQRGASPSSAKVQALAARVDALVAVITGGDPGIRQGLTALYRADPDASAAAVGPGIDRSVFEYLGRARAAGRS